MENHIVVAPPTTMERWAPRRRSWYFKPWVVVILSMLVCGAAGFVYGALSI